MQRVLLDIIEKVNDVIGKVTLFGHVGKQKFRNNGVYELRATGRSASSTEVLGVTVGIFGTGTDAESAAYTNRFGKNIFHQPVRRLHPEDVLILDRRGESPPRPTKTGSARRSADPAHKPCLYTVFTAARVDLTRS